MAAARNRRANVRIRVLHGLHRHRPQQLLQQAVAPLYAQFLGQHPKRILRSHKVHAGHTLVGFQRAQQLAAKDRAGRASQTNGKI